MSGALGSIINDKRVAAFDLVPAGTKLDLSNGYRPVIDAIRYGVGPAATYTGKNGKFHVAGMDWASKPYGSIPGGYMSDGNPGPVDSGILSDMSSAMCDAHGVPGIRDFSGAAMLLPSGLKMQ